MSSRTFKNKIKKLAPRQYDALWNFKEKLMGTKVDNKNIAQLEVDTDLIFAEDTENTENIISNHPNHLLKIRTIRVVNDRLRIDGRIYFSLEDYQYINHVYIQMNDIKYFFGESDRIYYEFVTMNDSVKLSFTYDYRFSENYEYISFGINYADGYDEKLRIKYPNNNYKLVQDENRFAWGNEWEIYVDHFVGDYGQALAIRYLREMINDEIRYDSMIVPIGNTLDFDVFADDVISISEYVSSLTETSVEDYRSAVPEDIKKAILCYITASFSKAPDYFAVYEPQIEDNTLRWNNISEVLNIIDDIYILRHNTNRYMKAFLLNLKYRNDCNLIIPENNSKELLMKYNDTTLYYLSTFETYIFRICINGDNLEIEGGFHFPAGINFDEIYPIARINNNDIQLDIIENMDDRYKFDRLYLKEIGFKMTIPSNDKQLKVKFGILSDDNITITRKLIYKNLVSPVNNDTRDGYALIGNNVIQAKSNELIITGVGDIKSLSYRELFVRNEINKNKILAKAETRAAFFIREFYSLFNYEFDSDMYSDLLERLERYRGSVSDYENIQYIVYRYIDPRNRYRRNRIWLILDRPDRADDNGEALFRYLSTLKTSGIDVYFALKKDAPGYEELCEVGHVIEPLSISHCLIHSIAEYVISSQMQEFVMNPYNKKQIYLRDISKNPKFIFLQHGVIHNHHGKVMGKYGRDFSGFIVSGKPEYDYIKSSHFHYTEKEVWLTGLARFDRLYNDDKKIITIMPTWRKWLTHRDFDEKINSLAWIVNDDFEETEYFRFYNGLINDERLLEAAKRCGYRIAMLPHVNFLHLSDRFNCPEEVTVYDYEMPYRKVFAESSLILTDYTSAVFDFAYLHKPIVYCQFDKEEFYLRHTVNKGYFDFERDGFGEVTYDVDSCIDTLIDYMEKGCELKELYKERIDNFFPETDRKCCERIYQRLLNTR